MDKKYFLIYVAILLLIKTNTVSSHYIIKTRLEDIVNENETIAVVIPEIEPFAYLKYFDDKAEIHLTGFATDLFEKINEYGLFDGINNFRNSSDEDSFIRVIKETKSSGDGRISELLTDTASLKSHMAIGPIMQTPSSQNEDLIFSKKLIEFKPILLTRQPFASLSEALKSDNVKIIVSENSPEFEWLEQRSQRSAAPGTSSLDILAHRLKNNLQPVVKAKNQCEAFGLFNGSDAYSLFTTDILTTWLQDGAVKTVKVKNDEAVPFAYVAAFHPEFEKYRQTFDDAVGELVKKQDLQKIIYKWFAKPLRCAGRGRGVGVLSAMCMIAVAFLV